MKHINVATYNICHGRYADLDWSRIASAIREADADIVGLQEIDMGTNRVGGLDTVAALTAATGLTHALFVPAMDYDGGQYGTAILSRYPLSDTQTGFLKKIKFNYAVSPFKKSGIKLFIGQRGCGIKLGRIAFDTFDGSGVRRQLSVGKH